MEWNKMNLIYLWPFEISKAFHQNDRSSGTARSRYYRQKSEQSIFPDRYFLPRTMSEFSKNLRRVAWISFPRFSSPRRRPPVVSRIQQRDHVVDCHLILPDCSSQTTCRSLIEDSRTAPSLHFPRIQKINPIEDLADSGRNLSDPAFQTAEDFSPL